MEKLVKKVNDDYQYGNVTLSDIRLLLDVLQGNFIGSYNVNFDEDGIGKVIIKAEFDLVYNFVVQRIDGYGNYYRKNPHHLRK